MIEQAFLNFYFYRTTFHISSLIINIYLWLSLLIWLLLLIKPFFENFISYKDGEYLYSNYRNITSSDYYYQSKNSSNITTSQTSSATTPRITNLRQRRNFQSTRCGRVRGRLVTRWHLVLASTRFTARLHCVARPQNDPRQSPSVARAEAWDYARFRRHDGMALGDTRQDNRARTTGIFDKCRVSPRLL